MQRGFRIGLLSSLASLVLAGGAWAGVTPPSYVGVAHVAPGGQNSGLTSGPATYQASSEYGAATASLTYDVPGGSLYAKSNAVITGHAYGLNLLDYTFQIQPKTGAPIDAPIQLGVTASGYTNAVGSGGTANIELFVWAQGIDGIHDFVETSHNSPGDKTYTYSGGSILMPVDYDINVRMRVNAYADGGLPSCTTDCEAWAEAYLDPIFTILGPNADDYVIVGVPGPSGSPATAVPEPATWAMLVGGFGLVGGALRRRRQVADRFA